MRKIQLIGVTLAVMAAMAAVTSVAAAHEFVSTGTGELSVTRNTTQKITTRFGNLECTGLAIKAKVKTTKALEIHETLTWTSCTIIGVAASVSTVLKLLLANGEIHFKNSWLVSGLGCMLTFSSQSRGTVKYINTGKELETRFEVSGIEYAGTGSLCNGTGKDGAYTGASVLALAGQTIEWK